MFVTPSRVIALVVLASVAVGSYYLGAKTVQSKTESVEEDKVRKDIQTEVREVIRPDGSRETVTRTTDRSKEDSRSKVTVIVKPKQYFVSIAQISAIRTRDKAAESAYEVTAYRRMYSSIYLGIGFDSKQRYRLAVGLEF